MALRVELYEEQIKLRENVILMNEGRTVDDLLRFVSDNGERRGLKIALSLLTEDYIGAGLEERLEDLLGEQKQEEQTNGNDS